MTQKARLEKAMLDQNEKHAAEIREIKRQLRMPETALSTLRPSPSGTQNTAALARAVAANSTERQRGSALVRGDSGQTAIQQTAVLEAKKGLLLAYKAHERQALVPYAHEEQGDKEHELAVRDAAALIRLSHVDIDPVLQELLRTEKEYVEDLRALTNAKADLVSRGLLSDADAKLLFSNVPVLLELHVVLLSLLHGQDTVHDLQQGQEATHESEEPSNEIVAAAFAWIGPFFRLCAPRHHLPMTLPCPPCSSRTARLLSDAGGMCRR